MWSCGGKGLQRPLPPDDADLGRLYLYDFWTRKDCVLPATIFPTIILISPLYQQRWSEVCHFFLPMVDLVTDCSASSFIRMTSAVFVMGRLVRRLAAFY
jgi:hypothetical protein